MKRRALLVAGAGGCLSSLAGCTSIGEEGDKPVDRASVIRDIERSVEQEGIEVIRTFSDWYGEGRDYRLWYVTAADSSGPSKSEMVVIGGTFAERVPSHDYAGGLLVSSWTNPEQEGDRWNYFIDTEWAIERALQEIDEDTYLERIRETLNATPQ